MVKILLALLLVLNALAANAITPDELRAMSANKDREDMQRRERANTGALDDLLPKKKIEQKPNSVKYGSTPSNNEQSKRPARTRPPKTKPTNQPAAVTEQPAEAINPNIYIPPARNAGKAGQLAVSDAVTSDTKTFGIRLGTWMPADLSRSTSSAEPGTVELSLSADVDGDKRTLPAGTVLFAAKNLNSGTKRMEMLVTHGITPDGQEFKMRGIVFDPQKISGLPGIFVMDDKNVVKHGTQKGLTAAVGAVAKTFTGSPIAAAGGAATESVLSDTGAAMEYNNAPTAVIYVSPQSLIIRVEERF